MQINGQDQNKELGKNTILNEYFSNINPKDNDIEVEPRYNIL